MKRLCLFFLLCLLAIPTKAAITIDAKVSGDQNSAATTVASPAFSTTSGSELLLAFVSTDDSGSGTNIVVNSVAGGGLTWTLVVRSNGQRGTSEIWKAFASSTLTNVTVTATLSKSAASSISVMSFAGVDSTGTGGSGAIGATKATNAATGAPTASLITTRNNSLVVGVGNDYDRAVARTVGTGQSLIHQLLSASGDTYWMQQQIATTPASGTSVTINDTAPTNDRYNLAICEILAPSVVVQTFSISGTITPPANGSGTTVTLSGAAGATTTADASGNYTFSGLANGTYTVTPAKSGLTFNPTSQTVVVNGSNLTGVNFVVPTFSISGAISPATSGVTVALSGAASGSTTTDVNGNFSFSGLLNGAYTVTPSKSGSTFTPASQGVTISGSSVTAVNFTIQVIPTYSISGNISPAASASGSTISMSGSATATTTADASGNFTFSGLQNGTYTLRPSKAGFTFNPVNVLVTVNGADQPGNNFTISAIPTFTISGSITPASVGTGTTLALSGSSTASATADSSGNYSFPNIQNGNYVVTPSKTGASFTPPSQSVTVNGADSPGVNFTGQVSQAATLAVDVTVSADQNSAVTTIATPTFSTSFPNELLLAFVASDSSSIGNTTVSSVTGGGLTWVLVARSNAQGGDSEIWRAFAANTLTNATVTATLSNKADVSMTVVSFAGADPNGSSGSGAIGATKTASGASGAPSATLTTTRANSWVFGVANDYDNAIARTPAAGQSLVHQLLSNSGDTYWVQRQNVTTANSGSVVGINDTAPTGDRFNMVIVEVLPSTGTGGGGTPPTVSMIAPAPSQTVAGKTTLAAKASGVSAAITGVQFLLDGANLGAQVTVAPYFLTWDSTTVSAGNHTLAATAFDSAGNHTTSTFITINVDNSGNPAVVGSWSVPVSLPTVAVNLTLLKNNKVLFYEDGATSTVWDYNAGIFTSVPMNANLFCSGQSALPDGRILIVGGFGGSGSQLGIANAELFDPSNNTWTKLPNMSFKRWYPTATPLSDGRMIVMAGWQTSSHTNVGIPEIYDPTTNSWSQLSTANNPFETYPFIYQLTDGRLIHVGGTEYATITDILNLTTGTWSTIDPSILDGGSANMYLPNKIIKAGSATDSQNVGPSLNTAYVLDMTQANPKWQQIPSMAYPRSFLNLTELPDGTVLATGGETDKDGGNISNAVYAAELWNPTTQAWTTMASMHTPREYHGTALLLPDGRVLESGMGSDFGNVPDEMSAEFYSPPYLFKGARPTITSAPTDVAYGANFFVATPDAANITSAVMIRTGAVTHFFDQNTRYVPVSFTQTTGGLTITAPSAANFAPAGHYMLFLLNSNGVPAVAPIIQLHP